jgi:hypothetical protein
MLWRVSHSTVLVSAKNLKYTEEFSIVPPVAYCTERFHIIPELGVLCRTFLSIHLLWDLRRKLSVY